MEPEPRKSPIRFYEIDLLRFLAALAVVFYHYTYWWHARTGYSASHFVEIGRVTKYGYLGVELFFIISGYVVLLSAQGKTVRQFFLSRITRLYPAYWAACTLTFLTAYFWGVGPASLYLHAGIAQYGANMTMLHDFVGFTPIDGAYWSLTIEITFYFLVSLLIGYRLMQHIDWFLIGWLAYAAIPHIARTGTGFSMLFFPNYAPYFAAGILFYLLQQPQGRSLRRYTLLTTAYLLSIWCSTSHAQILSTTFKDEFSPMVVTCMITLFFILFYLVSTRKINFSRYSWLAWPGAITYPLYLIHSHIGYNIFFRFGHLFNKYILLSITILFMLIIAFLIHVFIEKRFSKPLGIFVTKWLDVLAQKS